MEGQFVGLLGVLRTSVRVGSAFKGIFDVGKRLKITDVLRLSFQGRDNGCSCGVTEFPLFQLSKTQGKDISNSERIGRWTLDTGHWTLDIGHWALDIGLREGLKERRASVGSSVSAVIFQGQRREINRRTLNQSLG